MTRPPMLAADHIRELVQPYTTTDTVRQPQQGDDGRWRTTRRLHTVNHPALLDQLAAAAGDSSSLSDDDASRSAFKSKPAAHLEALDILGRIDARSHELAVDLGIEQPRRTRTVVAGLSLRDRLLAISGKIGDQPHPAVKSWWAMARVATHWDAPPLRPHATPCPACWATDSLRIRLDEYLASCTACGTLWDQSGDPRHGSLQVLAAHVKWCAEHEVGRPRHWRHDDTGELIECTGCLAFRTEWAEARLANAAGLLDGNARTTA